MTRIAIGGFLHESHSFAPLPTGWHEFVKPGGFPPLQRPAGSAANGYANRHWA